MVVLNRIYTRTGDDGTTALGSGERRPKYDLRVAAYGTVDETNAVLGVARLHLKDARELDAMLGLIQNDLFDLGADLAVPQREGKAERWRVVSSQAERLGHDIDSRNADLAPRALTGIGGTFRFRANPKAKFARKRIDEGSGSGKAGGRFQRQGPGQKRRIGRGTRQRQDVDESVRRNRGRGSVAPERGR